MVGDLSRTFETVSPTVAELEAWDTDHVWHSFTQMRHYKPFIVESAYGCRLVDIHGNEFIDGVSSLWCNVHGHRHPTINAAIKAQLDRVAHVTNLGAGNDQTVQLARELVEVTPAGLDHVFFCSDGANAIEVALKMAFQFWQQCNSPQTSRTKYIALSDAYHGDTIGTVAVGDVPLFHKMFRPLLFEPIRVHAPNAYDINAGSPERQLKSSLQKIDKLLTEQAGEVAAIVAEPLVQGAAGIKIHPTGYLRGLRELATKHDVLLIADEVAVGFGRTGTLFACEQESVSPDILCLGKGLSGGYLPISATLTCSRVYDAFLGDYADRKTLYHGHTFAGNPLACAASLANLSIFRQEETLVRLAPKMAQIAERLERLTFHAGIESPRQKGMIAAFDLSVDDPGLAVQAGYDFCERVQSFGVRIRPLGSTIIIMPPLVISEAEIDVIFDAIEFAMDS